MAQVKFYSKSALPSSNVNPDGVYFINGGELYKGAQRFGLARVTAVAEPSTTLTTAARGDINVYEGTAAVFDGNSWIALTDGALAAKVSAIESVVSVVTTQESQETVTTKTVTADTGSFTNLTVGGSTVNQIAQAEISAKTAASISDSQGTSLVTEGQVIDYVSAAVTSMGNVMHFAGVWSGSSQATLPSEGNVLGDIRIIAACTDENEEYAAGYAVGQEYIWDGTKWELIGDQTTGATKSYVEAAIASSMAYSSATGVLAGASTFSGAVSALASAIDGAKATISDQDDSSTDLVTASAVVNYVQAEITNFASSITGGAASSAASGITVSVYTDPVTAAPSVRLSVALDTDIGPSQTIPASGDDPGAEGYTPEVPAATDEEIPSSLAVRKAIEAAIQDATLEWITDD